MFNSMGEKIVGTGGMGQMARKMLKEEHDTTPEQLQRCWRRGPTIRLMG